LAFQDTITVEIFDRDDPTKIAAKLDHWEAYDINNPPPWEGCASFSLTPSPTKAVFELFDVPGQKIKITSGYHPQFTGIVDEISSGATPNGKTITITGRDMGGLLVDSAAPRMSLKGYTFKKLVETLLQPWHPEYIEGITTNNAVNFYRMTGIARKDKHHFGHMVGMTKKDPASQTKVIKAAYFVDKKTYSSPYGGYDVEQSPHGWGQAVGTKIKVRTTREWRVKGGKNSPEFRGFDNDILKRIRGGERVKDVIDQLAKQVAGCAWMTGDSWFFVGRPRYSEKPYTKLVAKPGQLEYVKAVKRVVSIADRHSIHWATGKGRSVKTKRGRSASHRVGCFDPSPAFWKDTYSRTLDERLYKPTILEARRGSRDEKMLRRMVRTKLEESLVKAYQYEWQVRGHHNNDILWNVDACVEVQDEIHNVNDDFYICGRRFVKSLQGGTSTVLQLCPKDIYLAVDHDEMNDDDYADYLRQRVLW
jgi:prophage tail gpP-like protein